jgi:very-short-patch-repair endonuclease
MARRPTALARRLRRDATDAERRLWQALRERLPGWKFRRQHPIGPHIADFACPACKLAIEIDGGQHAHQAGADATRTAALAAAGYRVVRFWNNEVLENAEGVLEAIAREIARAPPHPGPLRPLKAERER